LRVRRRRCTLQRKSQLSNTPMSSGAERKLTIIREILASIAPRPDQLLPALLEVQHRIGCVSNACIAASAQHFNLSRADVYGVASFYHDLRLEPVGDHIVQICQAEACQAVGCRALAAHAECRLGVKIGTTSPDARITLEAAYCFGNCACGPTVRIDDAIHGRVTPERFDALVGALPGTRA
jgi:formate dehydrogenase subunit gamma